MATASLLSGFVIIEVLSHALTLIVPMLRSVTLVYVGWVQGGGSGKVCDGLARWLTAEPGFRVFSLDLKHSQRPCCQVQGSQSMWAISSHSYWSSSRAVVSKWLTPCLSVLESFLFFLLDAIQFFFFI